jgi:hypothetical protein
MRTISSPALERNGYKLALATLKVLQCTHNSLVDDGLEQRKRIMAAVQGFGISIRVNKYTHRVPEVALEAKTARAITMNEGT